MDYPSTLPSPTAGGYQVNVSYGLVSTRFENGQARQRRTTKKEAKQLSLSFTCTGQQLWTWQSWANANGYSWHYASVLTDYSGIRPGTPMKHLLRYTGDITIEALGVNIYRAYVVAEVQVGSIPDILFTPTGNWIIGRRPFNPPADTISAETAGGLATDIIKAGYPGLPAA